jgi:hypothetical protein
MTKPTTTPPAPPQPDPKFCDELDVDLPKTGIKCGLLLPCPHHSTGDE